MRAYVSLFSPIVSALLFVGCGGPSSDDVGVGESCEASQLDNLACSDRGQSILRCASLQEWELVQDCAAQFENGYCAVVSGQPVCLFPE